MAAINLSAQFLYFIQELYFLFLSGLLSEELQRNVLVLKHSVVSASGACLAASCSRLTGPSGVSMLGCCSAVNFKTLKVSN